ncbi:MAG: hypothetical protein WBZ36_09380 [Candidatus Nitrosopolaris sp.]
MEIIEDVVNLEIPVKLRCEGVKGLVIRQGATKAKGMARFRVRMEETNDGFTVKDKLRRVTTGTIEDDSRKTLDDELAWKN